MSQENQIILIKKKKAHHGHHGGAWKVAYADFVTAMMALFIVLWLMNTSKPIQEAVGGYFRDPKGTADKKGTDFRGAGNAGAAKKDDMSKLKEELVKSLQKMAGFEKLKNQIEMTITPEGLRIELLETPNGTFFENGKAQPTSTLADLLKILSAETGKLPNSISIEGHTDAKPYASPDGYSNWELSTDRANMARRLMESSGLRPGQVVQVRGFADHNLRKPDAPMDASNRRVSVIIQYTTNMGQQPDAAMFDGVTPLEGSTPGGSESAAPPKLEKAAAGSAPALSGSPAAPKSEKTAAGGPPALSDSAAPSKLEKALAAAEK